MAASWQVMTVLQIVLYFTTISAIEASRGVFQAPPGIPLLGCLTTFVRISNFVIVWQVCSFIAMFHTWLMRVSSIVCLLVASKCQYLLISFTKMEVVLHSPSPHPAFLQRCIFCWCFGNSGSMFVVRIGSSLLPLWWPFTVMEHSSFSCKLSVPVVNKPLTLTSF